ncbi:MAG: hypothetical protein PF440_10645 [Thiomicrorhabdus sp.]|jgi:beta-lactamase class D|nr:hypothetical protein [Thiomicrorhabdus sp.]
MQLPEAIEHKDFLSEDKYEIVITAKQRKAAKAARQKRRKEIYVPRDDFNCFTSG